MKNLVLVLLLLVPLVLSAGTYKDVKMKMVDGSERKGLIKFPIKQRTITFIEHKDAEKEKIKADDIYRLYISTENGTYILERTISKLNINKKYFKITKKKTWLLVLRRCKDTDLYISGHEFKVDRHGTIVSEISGQRGIAAWYLLVKGPNDEIPNSLSEETPGATVIGNKKRFRQITSIYFKDYPQLVERIQNKEFKANLRALFDAYCDM